jgi:hypothetical protein
MIVKLQRDPDSIVPLLLKHRSDDGRVHATRHGNDNAQGPAFSAALAGRQFDGRGHGA